MKSSEGGSSICPKPLVITVDGPAGSGKSTIAKLMAGALGLRYLNSGAIYRVVTLVVMESGTSFDDREAVASIVQGLSFRSEQTKDGLRFFLAERDVTERLKDPDVTSHVYRIANNGDYRKLLVTLQRSFAEGKGVVAEGRDMGTVIFPDADLKFYLEAPVEERALRQHMELEARGVSSRFEDVFEKVKERDHRDTSRPTAPLRPAENAVRIDSGGLTIEEVLECFMKHVEGFLSTSRVRRPGEDGHG